jgi:hypothetical protein
MQTAAPGQGKLSKDSLMNLFDKPSQTLCRTAAASTTSTTTTTDTTTTTPNTTTTTAASSPLRVPSLPVKLSQHFNITPPNKLKLAMELVTEMDTPKEASLMRELVKGSTITIETLNNSQKKCIHIPQFSDQPSASCKMLSINLFKKLSTPCWELEPKRPQTV